MCRCATVCSGALGVLAVGALVCGFTYTMFPLAMAGACLIGVASMSLICTSVASPLPPAPRSGPDVEVTFSGCRVEAVLGLGRDVLAYLCQESQQGAEVPAPTGPTEPCHWYVTWRCRNTGAARQLESQLKRWMEGRANLSWLQATGRSPVLTEDEDHWLPAPNLSQR